MLRKSTLPLLLLFLGCCSSTFGQSDPCPPNIDFEYGSFAFWTCYTGSYGTGMTPLAATPTACPPVNGRHNIMAGAGTDYYGGFPIVDPGGGAYAARIGYDTGNTKAERIRYYVHVPSGAATFDLVYRYAIDLENPGHTAPEQPWFNVTATDSATGITEPCASYNYVSSTGLAGFTTSSVNSRFGNGPDVQYSNWNTATLNLTGLGGTTVAVDFAAGGCSLGGHFGYAYVDMTCGLFQVQGLTCNDTATHVTLSAPSGFEFYNWYDSATFLTSYGATQTITIPVPSGPITLAVILTPYAGYGCTDTLYTHISPSHLALNPMHDTLICNGDSIRLNAGATDVAIPLSYIWSGPGLSCNTCANPWAHAPIGTNVYSVTVTNVVGCSKDTTITIRVDNLSAFLTKFDDTCHNGSVGWARATVTSGTAPINYSWNTTPPQTTPTATGLYGNGPAGDIYYTVTITDGAGCSFIDSIAIKDGQPTDLHVIYSQNPDSCDIADGFIVLDSLIAGQMFTIAYDSNGVTRTQTRMANALWQDTLVHLGRGLYNNIRVITTHCPYNIVGPVSLVDPPWPVLPAVSSNSPVCFGGTLNITAISSSGVAYSWTGPAGFASGTQNPTIGPVTFADSGLYKVVVSRVNCFDSNYVPVRINPTPIPSAGSNTPVCSNDTLRLNSASANGASYYVWNGPNGFYSHQENPVIGDVQVAASGVYTVTVVLNGCVDTISTTVLINQTPPAPVVSDTEYCQHSTAAPFSANVTGTNLLWYTNATGGNGSPVVPTPSTLLEGIVKWYVSQTSAAGCEGPRAPVTAQIDYLASPSMTISDTVICRGSDILIAAVNTGDDMTGITWSFSDGHEINDISSLKHSFTGTGVFTVTATALYKVCPPEEMVRTVKVYAAPNQVYLGQDTSMCPGSDAFVLADNNNAGMAGVSWMWSTGETTSQIRVTSPGVYTVKVTLNGCSSTDTLNVAKDCYMDLPNVFTPNGDGLNDYFFPRSLLTRGIVAFSMQIYNRWGQEVFTTSSVDGRGWDGRFNDAAQPEGVYVYVIDATFKDGQKEHHQGNVTLLR